MTRGQQEPSLRGKPSSVAVNRSVGWSPFPRSSTSVPISPSRSPLPPGSRRPRQTTPAASPIFRPCLLPNERSCQSRSDSAPTRTCERDVSSAFDVTPGDFMRATTFALSMALALGSLPALAHGPQIQITRDNHQITTRRLLREEPYSAQLTPPTTVYAIPLLETEDVWYSRPNNTPSATLPGAPEYLSGPGIAYGYDQVDGGPRAFASGNRFE